MGCYDTVEVPCPRCGTFVEAQSKGGACSFERYTLASAPTAVMADVNRHAPFACDECGAVFKVAVRTIGVPVEMRGGSECDDCGMMSCNGDCEG